MGCLGSIAAFITTVKAIRYLRFSLKLDVESDFLRWGWAGSDMDLMPLFIRLCICIDAALPLLIFVIVNCPAA